MKVSFGEVLTGTLSALRTITHSGITHRGHTNPREFLPTYRPVISTEVAHSRIVGRAVEKSASLPDFPPATAESLPPPHAPSVILSAAKNILQKRGKFK